MELDPKTLLVAAIGVIIFFVLYKKQQARVASHVAQLNPSNLASGQPKRKELGVFSAEEVGRHNRRDDCWIIVRDKQGGGAAKVYDVTQYIEEHPGGEDAILSRAGGDATEGFLGPQHPATVFVLVEDFLIGHLASQ